MVVAAGVGVTVLAYRQADEEHRAPRLPAEPAQSRVAYAAGTSAANIALDDPGEQLALRWVARHAGEISRLHLQGKVATDTCRGRDDGRPNYAAGDTGQWQVTTYRTTAAGDPDPAAQLAQETFQPCSRVDRSTFSIALGFAVQLDEEFVTVVRNVAPDPEANFASVNFLFTDPGLRGAQARDERSPDADDGLYGLDPRESVGWSTDGGESWRFPGGPYGPDDGAGFIPAYVQEFADGTRTGQPYYYSRPPADGPVAVEYRDIARAWTIDAVGAHTFGAGAADVVVEVDGKEAARVRLEGDGWLEQAIDPVQAKAGSTVRIETVAGADGLAITEMRPDRPWADLMGLGRGFEFFSDSDTPERMPTVYLLPTLDAQPPA